LNRDKKFSAKGSKKGKTTSTHEVNTMDIDPAAVTAINKLEMNASHWNAISLEMNAMHGC
jgi:hypothetical protein